jgi:hypothetical protein
MIADRPRRRQQGVIALDWRQSAQDAFDKSHDRATLLAVFELAVST